MNIEHDKQVKELLDCHLVSMKQEFWCWRFAYHGNAMKAAREAYPTCVNNFGTQNTYAWRQKKKPGPRRRIRELRDAHRSGIIDLSLGPWYYYPWHKDYNRIDPGNSIKPIIQDFWRNEEEFIDGKL